jgi:hypothetical protein
MLVLPDKARVRRNLTAKEKHERQKKYNRECARRRRAAIKAGTWVPPYIAKRFRYATMQQRIKQLCSFRDNGCWEWMSVCSTQPVMKINNVIRPVRRVTYVEWVGTLEDHEIVRSTCQNHRCVNPDHLVKMEAGFRKSYRDKLRMVTRKRDSFVKMSYTTPNGG